MIQTAFFHKTWGRKCHQSIDSGGEPIGSATVKFFIEVDFFASGLMEIGEAPTNDRGVAVFEYTPRQAGDTRVVAHYETIETAATLTLAGTDAHYRPP